MSVAKLLERHSALSENLGSREDAEHLSDIYSEWIGRLTVLPLIYLYYLIYIHL
jgi:hypothetical protein